MMNETLALFSYGWTRHQKLAKIIFAVTAISLALTGLAWMMNFSDVVVRTFAQCMAIGVFGCFLLPLGLFSMSPKDNMLNEVSGYDAWLLRLPIPSWKLAIIPALLVTAWLTVLWLMIAVPARIWGDVPMPIISQVMAMSSGAIIVFSLIWKPQRFIWLRGVAFVVAVPLAYFSTGACIGCALHAPEFMPLVVIASAASYVASVAFAIYSIKCARISTFQQSTTAKSVSVSRHVSDSSRIDFRSRIAALFWHDTRRARLNQIRMSVMIIPMLLFCTCILPLSGATAIVCLFSSSFMCMVCASMNCEPAVFGINSSLPSYLIASPFSSREIAYGRLINISIAFVILAFLMSLSLMPSLLWKSNLATAERWWMSTAVSLSTLAPLRMILFTYVATLIVSLGVLLRMVCVQMYGRQSVATGLTGVVFIALVTPFGFVLRWFLKQTNWEDVTLVVTSWMNWSYSLIYIALAIKLSVDFVIALQVDRRLVSVREIMQFIVGWCVLVIGATVTAWMVWPAPSFTLTTALMASAIVIPLSPFLLAPAAVDANRHRSIPIGSVVRMD